MAAFGQVYTIYLRNWTGVASATNPTVQINLASSKSLEVIRLEISQNNSTTSGNAEYDIGYGTATATGTLTLTNASSNKVNASDPAPGFALKDGGFTSATSGLVVVRRKAFNILNGELYLPVPEERIVIRATDGFASFRLLATPGSTNYNIELTVRELW